MGRSAGFSLTTGSFNTFVGPGFGGAGCGALIQSGNGNSFFGNVRTLDISNTIILADGGTNTTAGTQRLYIDNNGYTGLDLGNNIIPNNKLEINSIGAVTGTTGLRFRSFINANNPVGNRFLTLNSSGDMILASTSDNNWSLTGNANTTPSLLSGSPGSGYITSTNTSSFIGTTTNSDIVFRRNHLLSGAITPSNTIFGQLAVGLSNSTTTFSGADNAIFGSRAGFWMLSHNKNVIVGAEALSNLNADRNTAIGYKAGYNNYGGTPNGGMTGGEGNVYIGSEAGSPSNNIESNQLYIDNSSTLTPLIKGDFDSENLTFNVDANTNSRVTINSGLPYTFNTPGLSGLRLSNLTSGNSASASNGKVLSVDNNGDVILVNDATTSSIPENDWHITGNSDINNASLVSGNNIAPLPAAANYIGTSQDQDVVFRRDRLLSGQLTHFNTSFGEMALSSNVFTAAVPGVSFATGSNNTAFGNAALMNNISGANNVAVGFQALTNNVSGNQNVAVGQNALANSTGINNTSIGANAGSFITTGSHNVCVGNDSGRFLSTGWRNIFIGPVVLPNAPSVANTTVGNNTNGTVIISAVDPNNNTVMQRFIIHNNGFAGIGLPNNAIPQNQLELNGAVAGTLGLRFRGFNGNTNPTVAPNGRVLTIDNDGDVVLTTDQGISINAGTNVIVTGGTGTPASPYVVSAKNIYTDDGQITVTGSTAANPGTRTVTLGENNLFFNTNSSTFAHGTQGSGRIYIGNQMFLPNLNTTGPNFSQYRLLVEGGVLSEKVKVALRNPSTNWADYVFAHDYKLMPLKEVEAFVKENKHLPGIESADELVKNGLDLGEMQAKQMGKIEELTLHAIEQEKKLEAQAKEIEELKAILIALIKKNN